MEFSVEYEDTSKIQEQQIFINSVLGYCAHYNVINKNHYNINFPHLKDFTGLFSKEKYLNQSLNPSLSHKKRNFNFSSEFARALEDTLIAKNNYQRIILQMLDTIYNQSQRIKHQSHLLQLHNFFVARNDNTSLKNIVVSVAQDHHKENSSASTSLPHSIQRFSNFTTHVHSLDKEEAIKYVSKESQRSRHFSVGSSKSNSTKEIKSTKNLNVSISSIPAPKQTPRSEVTSLTQRQKSPAPKVSQKRSLTPRLDNVNISNIDKKQKTTLNSERRKSDASQLNKKEKPVPGQKSEPERRQSLKVMNTVKELCDQAVKLNKNVSYGIVSKYSISRVDKENMNGSVSPKKSQSKKKTGLSLCKSNNNLTRSIIEEDTHDNEYDSLKYERACMVRNDTELTMNTSYSQAQEEKRGDMWTGFRNAKAEFEQRLSVQNKSLSFQSNGENVFNNFTEEDENVKREERALREVVSNGQRQKENVWSGENIKQSKGNRKERKASEEHSFNLVTSPSFGAVGLTERSFDQNDENRYGAVTERVEKKIEDQKLIGKIYGNLNSFKERKWAPIFTKKI